MQIYSKVKLKQNVKIEMQNKIYKVLSCLDNAWLDNGKGYILTVEFLKNKGE